MLVKARCRFEDQHRPNVVWRHRLPPFSIDSLAMLKFQFNSKALEAFAKEIHRASWGIAAAIGAGGVMGTDWTPPWLIIGSMTA